jgi:hypothetical protein
MGPPKTPRSDALFGTFLQDVGGIRQKHARLFGSRYYRFDYAIGEQDGYCLSVEPNNFPKNVKREIMRAFDLRLNQDSRPTRSRIKKKNTKGNL